MSPTLWDITAHPSSYEGNEVRGALVTLLARYSMWLLTPFFTIASVSSQISRSSFRHTFPGFNWSPATIGLTPGPHDQELGQL